MTDRPVILPVIGQTVRAGRIVGVEALPSGGSVFGEYSARVLVQMEDGEEIEILCPYGDAEAEEIKRQIDLVIGAVTLADAAAAAEQASRKACEACEACKSE